MAAKAKGKSRGKVNEQKREEMEGSTVAPNKNGGWDREFVYECDDDRVPSNFEFRPLFDLFVFDQAYATLTFFFPSRNHLLNSYSSQNVKIFPVCGTAEPKRVHKDGLEPAPRK